MFIVFLIVHFFFAAIFYLLGAYIESALFATLGVLSFFFFAPFRLFQNQKEDQTKLVESRFDGIKESVGKKVVGFFSKSALFVSVAFFYGALFGILYSISESMGINLSSVISYIAITISVGVGVAFYLRLLSHPTILLIAETNIFFLALIFSGKLIFTQQGSPALLDVLTLWTLSLSMAAFVIYVFESISNPKLYENLRVHLKFPWIIILWIFFFITLFVTIQSMFQISMRGFAVILLLYSVVTFEGVRYPIFNKFRALLRAAAVFAVYIATVILIFGLLQNDYYGNILPIVVSLTFNLYIHSKFENYPSLTLSTLLPVAVYISIFGMPAGFFAAVGSMLLVSLGLTAFGRLIRTKHRYDEYIFQSTAVATLVVSMIYYGFKNGISGILEFSVLLLSLSVVIFVSFLQIRR